MEIREMLELYDAPDVRLSDIVCQNLPQKRLLSLLVDDGVTTTGKLMEMSDAEILALPLFGKMKMDKLREFVDDWYEQDFPFRNHMNITKPETVQRSLEEEVFGNYKNMAIIAMRGQYKTFEEIALQFGQSRQSIQGREKNIQRKFAEWYASHNVDEKIGDMDELSGYCDRNFPEDQTTMKLAVRRLATVAKRKK